MAHRITVGLVIVLLAVSCYIAGAFCGGFATHKEIFPPENGMEAVELDDSHGYIKDTYWALFIFTLVFGGLSNLSLIVSPVIMGSWYKVVMQAVTTASIVFSAAFAVFCGMELFELHKADEESGHHVHIDSDGKTMLEASYSLLLAHACVHAFWPVLLMLGPVTDYALVKSGNAPQSVAWRMRV